MEDSARRSHSPDFGIESRRSLIELSSLRPKFFPLGSERGVTAGAVWDGGVRNCEVDTGGHKGGVVVPDERHVTELTRSAAVLPPGLNPRRGLPDADPDLDASEDGPVRFPEFEVRCMRHSFRDPDNKADRRGVESSDRCLFDGAENGSGLGKTLPCLRFWVP